MASGMTAPTAAGGEGLFPTTTIVKCKYTSATGLTRGDCVQLDLANTTTGLSYDAKGEPGESVWNTVVDNEANAASISKESGYWFGLALEDAAQNDIIRIMFRGNFENANVAAATIEGATLVVQGGSAQLANTVTATPKGSKIVAIAREDDTANLADVWFNGVEGFGYDTTPGT